MASSRNYHHFFPKAYLKKAKRDNANSLMNITVVSADLNKRKIGAKAPSTYIGDFKVENPKIEEALQTHFISEKGFGIESDDYEIFLKSRAARIFKELKSRIELEHDEPKNEILEEMILVGESQFAEFKSTLRFDLRQNAVNKKLEHVIAKSIAGFLNSEGGNLFIGLDDDMNALGLEKDFSTLRKQDRDGFELQLLEVIKKYIGAEFSGHIKIHFPKYDGKEICWVEVSKSGRPVFITSEGNDEFFIRAGFSSQPLSREEQSLYERQHWGK